MARQTVRLDDEFMDGLRHAMVDRGGLKFQGLVEGLLSDWLSGESSQKSTERAAHQTPESDMISTAELSYEDRQLVLNLIAMLRDGRSQVLPILREGLRIYTPEARDEEAGRKSSRNRRKTA